MSEPLWQRRITAAKKDNVLFRYCFTSEYMAKCLCSGFSLDLPPSNRAVGGGGSFANSINRTMLAIGGRCGRRTEAADLNKNAANAIQISALVSAQRVRWSLQKEMTAFGNGSSRVLLWIGQLAVRILPIRLVRISYVRQIVSIRHRSNLTVEFSGIVA